MPWPASKCEAAVAAGQIWSKFAVTHAPLPDVHMPSDLVTGNACIAASEFQNTSVKPG